MIIISEYVVFIERDFGFFEGKLVVDILLFIIKYEFKIKGYEDNEVFLKRLSDVVNDLYKIY